MKLREYIKNVLVAGDVFGNTILKGRPSETLSERAATARRDGKRWGCWLCDYFLDKIETDHCALAMDGDKQRALQVIFDVGAPKQ